MADTPDLLVRLKVTAYIDVPVSGRDVEGLIGQDFDGAPLDFIGAATVAAFDKSDVDVTSDFLESGKGVGAELDTDHPDPIREDVVGS